MKRMTGLLAGLLMILCTAGLSGAATITYDYILADGIPTSAVQGAVVETFETFADSRLWTWGGNFKIVTGSVSGKYAAPAGDGTQYVTVPEDLNRDTLFATIDFGGSYNYFGLYWGSVDTYNSLSFYNNGEEVYSITGSGIKSPANGNQRSPKTNLYVNFDFYGTSKVFDEVRMISTSYAFEADNLAVAAVPESATMILVGAGLLGLAGVSRRRIERKS